MEEAKGEKRYQNYHKHVCSFLKDSGSSCMTTAAQVHRHSQDLSLKGHQKSGYGRTAAQPLLCSLVAVPLQLKQENQFSQIPL